MNFDTSPTLKFERIPLLGKLYTRNNERFPEAVRVGDVVRGLPVADRSCDGVYASHVLEHLSRTDFDIAVGETYRILKPGGIARVVVPDLAAAARSYLEATGAEDASAADDFMRGTHLGIETRAKGLKGIIHETLSNARHFWMWDYPGLAGAFRAHGFTDIRRGQFNDSEDEMFKAVEDAGRFEDAVCVEARRPA